MIETITLRRARPEDWAVLVEYNLGIAWETEHRRLQPEVVERGVRAVLADPAKGFYTVAEQGGRVVGQAMITFEYSDWRNGWYWWLQSVYVHPAARRGGVFRALFERLQQEAAADPSVIGLRLYVERDNRRARQTYEALGLVDEGYLVMGRYPLPGRPNAFAS